MHLLIALLLLLCGCGEGRAPNSEANKLAKEKKYPPFPEPPK